MFALWVVSEANSNKKLQLYFQKRLLGTKISRCWGFWTILFKEIAKKTLPKFHEIAKKIKIQSFLKILGPSEETLIHENCEILWKASCEPSYTIESF